MRKLMMMIAIGLVLAGCESKSSPQLEKAPFVFVDNSVARLSDTVGNPDKLTAPVPRERALCAAKDYQPGTGKWFEGENGTTLLAYSTSEDAEPGSLVEATLRRVPEGRSVRFQITRRDNEGNRLQLIKEYVADINDTIGERLDFSSTIPERPNTNYLHSIEIVSSKGAVEDTKLIPIFVRSNELNARLSVKQPTDGSDQPVLNLYNAGPTTLYFGYGYEVYHQTSDGWELLPGDRAVPAVGLSIKPGESHLEQISLAQKLEPGTYRVVKRFEGYKTDKSAKLAAEFEVK